MSKPKTDQEQAAALLRFTQLLNIEIDARELARLMRVAAFDITMNVMENVQEPPAPELKQVIYYLNKTAETLHPVMNNEA